MHAGKLQHMHMHMHYAPRVPAGLGSARPRIDHIRTDAKLPILHACAAPILGEQLVRLPSIWSNNSRNLFGGSHAQIFLVRADFSNSYRTNTFYVKALSARTYYDLYRCWYRLPKEATKVANSVQGVAQGDYFYSSNESKTPGADLFTHMCC